MAVAMTLDECVREIRCVEFDGKFYLQVLDERGWRDVASWPTWLGLEFLTSP